MSTTRQHLLAWVHAHGLAALDELFRDEAVALAGPKGRHQPQRTHHHWGTAATELAIFSRPSKRTVRSGMGFKMGFLPSPRLPPPVTRAARA